MTALARVSVIVTLLLSGCQQMSVRDDISTWVDAHCAPQTACIVDLAEIAGFDWDTMYVFPAGTRQDTVGSIIGMPYPDAETVSERMVFVAGGKIVRSEEQIPDYDARLPRNVAFLPAPGGNGYFMLKRNGAKADVHIETSGARVFYILTPRP